MFMLAVYSPHVNNSFFCCIIAICSKERCNMLYSISLYLENRSSCNFKPTPPTVLLYDSLCNSDGQRFGITNSCISSLRSYLKSVWLDLSSHSIRKDCSLLILRSVQNRELFELWSSPHFASWFWRLYKKACGNTEIARNMETRASVP